MERRLATSCCLLITIIMSMSTAAQEPQACVMQPACLGHDQGLPHAWVLPQAHRRPSACPPQLLLPHHCNADAVTYANTATASVNKGVCSTWYISAVYATRCLAASAACIQHCAPAGTTACCWNSELSPCAAAARRIKPLVWLACRMRSKIQYLGQAGRFCKLLASACQETQLAAMGDRTTYTRSAITCHMNGPPRPGVLFH